MPWGAVVAAGAVVGSAAIQSRSADKAAKAQTQSAEAANAEQARQFDAIREVLAPYIEGGADSLSAQRALLGLAGGDAQQVAVAGLAQSPQFLAMQQQGENAILQNAAATGGLRGGNTQAALAQFRPAALNSLIQQQFQNLGGLTSLGQNAAAMQGNAGMQTAANIGANLQNAGAAQAAGYLAKGAAQSQAFSQLAGLAGGYFF